MTDAAKVLWTPRADALTSSQAGRFIGWLQENRGISFDGYDELWHWSVSELEQFWGALWEFFGVRAHARYERVLSSREMPGATWFEGARLNYAEHALGRDEDRSRIAVIAHSQTRAPIELTFGDLREQVARGARGPGAPRRRPRRPRRRLPAEHPRDADRVPGHREPRSGVGDVRARVRAAQRDRALRRSSSPRCC